MEDYFQAKARLFNRLSSNSFAVINNDDAYGRRLKELTSCRVITYGIDTPAQVSARQLETFTTHSEFMVTAGREVFSLKTTLIGRHNVLNILAAIAWTYAEGIDLEIARSSLEKFSSVPGRLEKVDYARGISVFVDYAHTEDALRNVITTLKNLPFRRVIVVFGCGGDRDKTKRPKMGRVVTELADYAIITSDNPRSEDPHLIIDNIRSGIKKNNYIVEADRRQAIQKALSIAGTRDAVLVAGKGHEDYQVVKGQKTHFNDREVIVECLQSLS